MRIFDTYVQKLKYKVLTELARQTWVGNDAFSVFNDIANQVVKKGEPTMSCCIYKSYRGGEDPYRTGRQEGGS